MASLTALLRHRLACAPLLSLRAAPLPFAGGYMPPLPWASTAAVEGCGPWQRLAGEAAPDSPAAAAGSYCRWCKWHSSSASPQAEASPNSGSSEDAKAGQRTAPRPLEWQLLKARNSTVFEEVLRQHRDELDSQAVLAGAHKLRHLNRDVGIKSAKGAVDILTDRVTASPETLSPTALATFANILVKLDASSPNALSKVLDAVARQLLARKADFEPQDLTNFLWAIAKSNGADRDPSGRYTTGNKHRTRYKQATKTIQKEICRRTADFQPHEVAAVMWSYATLQQPAALAFTCFGPIITRRAHEFSASGLSNVVWAYGKLRHVVKVAAVFRAVENEVLKRPEEFTERELSNIAWAFGLRGDTSPELNKLLCQQLVAAPRSFTPAALTNIANAAAKKGRCPPEVYETMEREVLRHGHKFEPKALATMAKAFAVNRVDSPKAMDILGRHIAEKIESFQPFHVVCTLAGAFAGLNRDPHGLFDAVWSVSAQRASTPVRMKPGELATIVRSLAVMGHLSMDKMAHLRPRLEAMDREYDITLSDLCAFFQAELLLNPGLDPGASALPGPLFNKALRAWKQSMSNSSSSSEGQEEICQLLRGFRLPAQLEYKTANGLFTIDIAIPAARGGGPGVAVEVDGPRHYTTSRPHREIGLTVLRRRLLEAQGWTVVNLPLHEWNPMGGDRDRQEEWLRRKFEAAMVEL
eukprot:CAMPEP_0117658526 /NCGR_PEP_ID=MMETSP0804-20121206/5908_1 /TAXON_ID=1074897 /ORGANISM="Tetraselmis astigmatica, Strain CCMP880" /LENGTH=696 /DNA_ID=CAMNT_0005465047 /DNA_START=44 /DNA_END=2134 /DNA_ORIENTATION=-